METNEPQNETHEINETGFSHVEPGEFPLDALPPIMRRVAASIADTYRVPVAMPAMAALAIHAGAMGKIYQVVGAVHGYRSYGNLYVVIAAEGAACRSMSSGRS